MSDPIWGSRIQRDQVDQRAPCTCVNGPTNCRPHSCRGGGRERHFGGEDKSTLSRLQLIIYMAINRISFNFAHWTDTLPIRRQQCVCVLSADSQSVRQTDRTEVLALTDNPRGPALVLCMGPGRGSSETRLIQTRFIGKATRRRNAGRWQSEGSAEVEPCGRWRWMAGGGTTRSPLAG